MGKVVLQNIRQDITARFASWDPDAHGTTMCRLLDLTHYESLDRQTLAITGCRNFSGAPKPGSSHESSPLVTLDAQLDEKNKIGCTLLRRAMQVRACACY